MRFKLFPSTANYAKVNKGYIIVNSIEIKETLIKYADTFFGETPVLFAYLYGSYAIHQAHPFSDLDIVINNYIK